VDPKTPEPGKKEADAARFDERCQRATEALKDAREVQKTLGDYHPRVIEVLESLAREYGDTPAGQEAASTAAKLRTEQEAFRKREAAAAERLVAIERDVKAFLEKKRFGAAVRKYEEFPRKEFEDTGAARSVADGILFVNEKAKDEWTLGKTQSADLERQGRFEDAKKFFEGVGATWEMDSFTALAREEIRRLDAVLKTRKEADRNAQTQADQALLQAAEDEALRLAEAYDFAGARERIRGILPGGKTGAYLATPEAIAKARTLLGDYDLLAGFKARILSAADRRKGSARVRIPSGPGGEEKEGTVRGADDSSVQVQVGAATTSIPWASFRPEAFFEAAQRILGEEAGPDDRLSLGVFAMVLGLSDKVESQLNLAAREGAAPTRQAAESCLARFRAGAGKAGQQVEAEARSLYLRVVEQFQRAEAEANHDEACKLLKKALEDLDRLAKDFGHTQFVKERMGG
jgi:hypothetical protein